MTWFLEAARWNLGKRKEKRIYLGLRCGVTVVLVLSVWRQFSNPKNYLQTLFTRSQIYEVCKSTVLHSKLQVSWTQAKSSWWSYLRSFGRSLLSETALVSNVVVTAASNSFPLMSSSHQFPFKIPSNYQYCLDSYATTNRAKLASECHWWRMASVQSKELLFPGKYPESDYEVTQLKQTHSYLAFKLKDAIGRSAK